MRGELTDVKAQKTKFSLANNQMVESIAKVMKASTQEEV